MLAALALLVFQTGAVQEPAFTPTVDELMGHVAFLAHDRMRGRGAGTPEEGLAAAYVAAELRKLGLEPIEQTFTVEETVLGEIGLETHGFESRNVLARLEGGDPELASEHLLVGAHLDHLGVREDQVYNGADDNASGVAGLLGVARALAQGPRPRRSVVFCAFGAEEVGLRGSRHYVAEPVWPLDELVAMVNLDMIGHGNFLDGAAMKPIRMLAGLEPGPGVGVLGGNHCPPLLELAREAFEREALPMHAPEDYPPAIQRMAADMAGGRSDHAPFAEAGIPHLFFSTSEHDRYHQPTDDTDTVDAVVLLAIARATHRTLLAIDALDERPQFVE